LLKYVGAYSGAAVTSSKFDASVGGFGTHTLKYVFNSSNNCTDSAICSIVVNAKPSMGFSPLGFTCNNDASISILANGTPVGCWLGFLHLGVYQLIDTSSRSRNIRPFKF
tara:strand:+ start:4184 stop:4513 length:330 start_codon:yes stop_codon:yes gene_type:complete